MEVKEAMIRVDAPLGMSRLVLGASLLRGTEAA